MEKAMTHTAQLNVIFGCYKDKSHFVHLQKKNVLSEKVMVKTCKEFIHISHLYLNIHVMDL